MFLKDDATNWMSIDVHSDIDEQFLQKNGVEDIAAEHVVAIEDIEDFVWSHLAKR